MLPLNIKGASRFLRKWHLATLDIEHPEALWPETKGQAASLARIRGYPLHGAGGSGAGQGAAGLPENRPRHGDEDQGVTLSSAGSHAGILEQ